MKRNHILLDLETLDTIGATVVLTIGAAVIGHDLQRAGSFYRRLQIDPQIARGSTISASTLSWWSAQNPIAQEHALSDNAVSTLVTAEVVGLPSNYAGEVYHWVDDSLDNVERVSPETAIRDLREWLNSFEAPLVYGNGAGFDLPPIRHLDRQWGFKEDTVPFRNERCFRTLKNIFADVAPLRTIPTLLPHVAVTDAVHEAMCLQLIGQHTTLA